MAVGLGACAAVMAVAAVWGEVVVQGKVQPNRVNVVYWEKWTGSEGEEMRKVVNAFNRSQDRVFVQYLSISGVDNKTLLATAGGDPPDVAGLWAYDVFQFSDAHALNDLRGRADKAGLNASYYIPGYWDELNYNGGLWALPSTPASTAVYVNEDLVPAAYRSAKTFPQTIEALDAMSDKITTRNSDGGLKMTGFLPGEPGWWHWAWGYWFGGKLVDGDRLTIDTPETERAMKWIASYGKRLGNDAIQTFQSGFGTFSTPQDAFFSNKVAAEMTGVYKANYIRIYDPDLRWFAVPMPYPADRPDLAGRSVLDQDVLMIPRGAKHPDEAFEFIKFVQRQDVMEGLCSAHGKNSPLEKVSEAFFRNHPNKEIRLFDRLARSPRAFHAPKIGIFAQISAEMTNVFSEVNTGQDPKQALADAQVRLDGLWDTYRKQVLGR
jgi:ABC-type glycerol-3-phosphate transport system substrate-binding protein